MKKHALTLSCTMLWITATIFVSTAGAVDSFGDPFEGNKLQNPNWKWQNEPKNWDVGNTQKDFLHVEGEVNRNLWADDQSHFLFQETDTQELEIETHFFAKWATDSGVNGVVIKSPADNNWVTIKFWSRAGGTGQIQYQTKQNENGNGLTGNAGFVPKNGEAELFLRLAKEGDDYTSWYKTTENEKWIDIGVTTFKLTPPLQLGIFTGVAAAAGTLAVDYEYFRDNLNPFAVDPSGKTATMWGKIKSQF